MLEPEERFSRRGIGSVPGVVGLGMARWCMTLLVVGLLRSRNVFGLWSRFKPSKVVGAVSWLLTGPFFYLIFLGLVGTSSVSERAVCFQSKSTIGDARLCAGYIWKEKTG